jgi:hypothetical protein
MNASRNITGFDVEIGGVASSHWWKGFKLQLVFATYWVGQMGEGGYEDNNNNIHPRHSNSHWLWAGEISSFKSLVMSHNKAQVSWLPEL